VARAIKSAPEGISLFALAAEAEKLGVKAQPVELPFAGLKTAELPILAHILPNHYVAILASSGSHRSELLSGISVHLIDSSTILSL